VIVALLAAYLHAPIGLVQLVYEAGGTDAVAVVECESKFNPQAFRLEPRGHSSWGLFQLDNEWHLQWRYNLGKHIETGAAFLAECKEKTGGDFAAAVSLYNSGSMTKAIKWGRKVERVRDDLAHWLWLNLR
jgi:hypothetical protein